MYRLPIMLLGLAFSLTSHADEISWFIEAQMAEKKIPGLVYAITKSAKLVKRDVFGVANVEFQVPVDEKTVFPIASITKIFTSAAVLFLVEQGRFRLDDSITKLIPGLPKQWAEVTVRHCLSHTSGLPDTFDPKTEELVASTVEEVLEKLSTESVIPPGTKVAYNQTGYMLLKLIVERFDDRGIEEHLKLRFFDPLGMANTRYDDYREVVPNRSSIYTKLVPDLDRQGALPGPLDPEDPFSGAVISPDKIFKETYNYPLFEHGGAGLNSTIVDLIKWDIALSQGKVLPASVLDQAGRGFVLADGTTGLFGLGWAVRELNGRTVVQMGGGWLSWHLRIPSESLSVIVLTNLQGSERGEIANGIADLYLASLQD